MSVALSVYGVTPVMNHKIWRQTALLLEAAKIEQWTPGVVMVKFNLEYEGLESFLAAKNLEHTYYDSDALEAAGSAFLSVLNGTASPYTQEHFSALLSSLKTSAPLQDMVDDTMTVYDPTAQHLFMIHVDLALALLNP
jgi:hypothetical protein